MSALDDLLAQRAAGGVASVAPTPAASAAAPAPADLDAMLAARASGVPVPAPPGTAAPAVPRGALDQVGDFASALTHHLANLPHGIAQFIQNDLAYQTQLYQKGTKDLPKPVQKVLQGIPALGPLLTDNPVSRQIVSDAASDNQALAAREANYQKTTPDGAAATAGATVGEVAPLFFTGPMKALDSAGAWVGEHVAPYLPQFAQKMGGKLASGATQGAITSAAQPVTTAAPSLTDLVTGEQGPGFWEKKAGNAALGAALGSALPAAAGTARAAYQGIKNTAAPLVAPASVVAPNLERLLTRDGQLPVDDVISQLRAPSTFVDGSRATTAQVLAHPEVVMAEKTMANTPGAKAIFEDLANKNNAARVAALQKIASSPEALDAAIAARSDATQPLIHKLLNDPTTSQPVRAQAVLSKLDQLENSSFSTDPVVKKTLGAIRSQVNDAAAKTDVNAYTYTPKQLQALKDEPYVRPDLLDGIRQNLRNTISDNASNGAVSSKQEAGLQPLADHITSAIDGANPGYRDYLATYARTSQPINAMEAAGSVLEHVAGGGRGLNSSGDAQATLSGYRTALAKALRGSPYGLDPTSQAALEAIQSDLQRASISGSVKSSGSDTAFNLQAPGWLAGKLYGDGMEGAGKGVKAVAAALGAVGGSVVPHVGTAAGAYAGFKGASTVASMGASKVNALLAKALAEPEFAAELLTQAQKAKTALPPPGVSARIPQMNLLLGQALGQRNP